MADIRCSHCGKDNPDFFDNCQFCQSPLKSESMLHTGDEPKKVDTGELESVLPDWLQDARQQNRKAAAEEEASKASATSPKVQKSEPLDLLAGLASQSDSDDEEVPDWLASINPVKETPAAQEESPSDFFSQFEKKETQPPAAKPEQEPAPDWMQGIRKPAPEQEDQLGDWFSQPSADTGDKSAEPVADDNAWMSGLGTFDDAQQETPAQKEPEDLSWLHDLEATSKHTDELSLPKSDSGFDFASQPDSSQEDLSWLNNLGGTPAPSFEEPAASQLASSQEDLSWLNNLGGTSDSSTEEPALGQPESSQEDLGWLSNLGETSAPSYEEPAAKQPESSQDDLSWLGSFGEASAPSFEESTPKQPEASQGDLSWLGDFGNAPAPSPEESAPQQPESSQENLSWLNNLGCSEQEPASEEPATPAFADDTDWMKNLGQDESQPTEQPKFTPKMTAPLDENVVKDTTPDWLKSAMAEPSMPAPGELSMEWFSEHEKPADAGQTSEGFEETPASDIGEPAAVSTDFDLPFSDSSGTPPQDVKSLLDVDMPDWLSREPESAEAGHLESTSASVEDESLAPVELPSWVQAMRPVDSVIEELSASDADQVTERDGPLAGFRGVIPFAPIGSSLRPKALLLKLQATDEHQMGASLIEQIINNETALQPPKKTEGITSQRMIRWVLTAFIIVVLSFVTGTGMPSMFISASATANELSNRIAAMPENPNVLVVIDYEPSLAGELEAVVGPVFEQLAVSRHAVFTFVSMSPNGSGLVDRLMLNTDLSRGLGYQAGVQYFNSGFLPGGSAGVLGFINNPHMIPGVGVDAFSNFEAVILMTDNSESSRAWVEQLDIVKGNDPLIASKPLFMVSSAQAGPIMQSYVSSGQVDIMISGLSDAVQYEYVNNTHLRTAQSYWNAFGLGLALAIISIVLGSLWNLLMGIRERRAEAEQE